MSPRCDVAIIGAGPYGLSVAAHLRAAGVDVCIFGKPLGTWRDHMPKNMTLKSDGFASNLSAPAQDSTLRVWCDRHRKPYANQGLPVELEEFLAYGSDFIARFVGPVEDRIVEHVESSAAGYRLSLDNGEQISATRVVAATGISCFPYTPPALAALPPGRISHSYDHREGDAFAGQDVVIIGAGSSAIDLAALLHDCGAKVRIIARAPFIEYNSVPDPDAETLLYRLRRPASGIGRGWSSYFCANAPLMFYRLPDALRRRGVRSHMHPAAGWFMREKIEGRIETLLGREIAAAQETGSRVTLTLATPAGTREQISCDRVIAATGYRPDTRRMRFLAPSLRSRIASVRNTPVVSDNFETPAEGFHVIGPAVIDSFGPLMRFMVGAEFIAPRLGNHLARTLGVRTQRAA
ncbi:MAG TPA: NAD(P)/FAD-dependent oxidoreductase [Rhizomicrobium sp.]|jgi:thioredoxin reductase|nr:NAD(P)/FAD-dependent oxidoreductase [Rhizomicrobium sp.]